jgi:hypothetical protein
MLDHVQQSARQGATLSRRVGLVGCAGRPTSAVKLYCGASADRKIGMSWAEHRDLAIVLGRRHGRHGQAELSAATVRPSAVLTSSDAQVKAEQS